MPEPLTVTIRTDPDGTETLTVEHWPSETAFADGIWDQCDPAFMRRDGDTVIIEISNGRAAYQLGTLEGTSYPAYRVWSRLVATNAPPTRGLSITRPDRGGPG